LDLPFRLARRVFHRIWIQQTRQCHHPSAIKKSIASDLLPSPCSRATRSTLSRVPSGILIPVTGATATGQSCIRVTLFNSCYTMDNIADLIVDDHPVVRQGMISALDDEADFEVVGTAGSAEEALAVVRRSRPDIVLLDLELPGMSGVEAIPGLRVLVFTAYDTDERVLGAIKAGAKGYLLKGATAADLARAIRAVAEGGSALAPRVAAKLVAGGGAARRRPPDQARARGAAADRSGVGHQADRTHAQDQRAHGEVPHDLAPAQTWGRQPGSSGRAGRPAGIAGRPEGSRAPTRHGITAVPSRSRPPRPCASDR
jgi:DNA-binding NarL/FixJ family response regulator